MSLVRATKLCVHETLFCVFALIIVHSGSEVLFPSNLLLSTVPLHLRSIQRQRLSLARALYGDADVYLLDDPLSALDPLLGNSVLKEVSVHVKAKAAFLVPHCLLPSPAQIVENLSRKHDRRDVWQASSMEKMLIPPPLPLPSYALPYSQFTVPSHTTLCTLCTMCGIAPPNPVHTCCDDTQT